jgi:hypothetical protein
MMQQLKKKFYQSASGYSLAFWSVVLVVLVFIASSYPMMKLRFDIWQHVGNIDILVFNPDAKIVRSNWHSSWAFVLRALGAKDVFEYAVIIHRAQFVLNCVIIYFASRLLFSALLPTADIMNGRSDVSRKHWLSSLAISSVLVWLTIIGTVSTFQQAWIMWYSVNYQITLPILFLALALLVNGVAMPQSRKIIAMKFCGSLALLTLIYFYHAGELAYLVFYTPILLTCFTTKKNYKNTLILMAISLIIVLAGVKFYSDIVPGLIKLMKAGDWHQIKQRIIIDGLYNIQGGNRYLANWNELYALSVFLVVPTAILVWTKRVHFNKRVFLFIALSLVFCFIPTFKYSAGFASLISYEGIVNRYYFASFVFMMLPMVAYSVVWNVKLLRHPIILIAVVMISMGLVFSYSRSINHGGVYYQNVKSIRDSLYQDRVGLDMPAVEVVSIGRQIDEAEKKYGAEQIIFCANYDRSHIVRYVYRKDNILFHRGHLLISLDQCRDYAKSKNKLAVVID